MIAYTLPSPRPVTRLDRNLIVDQFPSFRFDNKVIRLVFRKQYRILAKKYRFPVIKKQNVQKCSEKKACINPIRDYYSTYFLYGKTINKKIVIIMVNHIGETKMIRQNRKHRRRNRMENRMRNRGRNKMKNRIMEHNGEIQG